MCGLLGWVRMWPRIRDDIVLGDGEGMVVADEIIDAETTVADDADQQALATLY